MQVLPHKLYHTPENKVAEDVFNCGVQLLIGGLDQLRNTNLVLNNMVLFCFFNTSYV